MRTTISLSVILVAAILALGDGAYVGENSRYAQRASNEETEDIERALDQLNDDVDENDVGDREPTREDAVQQLAHTLRINSQATSGGNTRFLNELNNEPSPLPLENERADLLRLNVQASSDSDDNELFWQELENQPGALAEEEGPEVIIAGSGQIQHGDQVAFQVLGEKSKYLQCKGTSSWPTYCTQSTGPGLFMDRGDWAKYPSATFRIYRRRGKGAVRVGEDIAIYFPEQKKWMKCDSAWCLKNTCPGYPTSSHGMANDKKWQVCSQNVFRIYARGRKLGQALQANDEILLFSLRYCKWVSVAGTWIAQGTCPGYSCPPAAYKYDTCYKSVFELWKR